MRPSARLPGRRSSPFGLDRLRSARGRRASSSEGRRGRVRRRRRSAYRRSSAGIGRGLRRRPGRSGERERRMSTVVARYRRERATGSASTWRRRLDGRVQSVVDPADAPGRRCRWSRGRPTECPAAGGELVEHRPVGRRRRGRLGSRRSAGPRHSPGRVPESGGEQGVRRLCPWVGSTTCLRGPRLAPQQAW